MYERFTDRARKVMQLANHEAMRFKHEYINTEHILLGLVKEGSGVGASALANRELNLRQIRLEVEKLVTSGPEQVHMPKLPQTPLAKKVIEVAMEKSRDLNHNYVGTEHILLGLLGVREGIANQVLMNLGASPDEIRKEVVALLGGSEEDDPSEDSASGKSSGKRPQLSSHRRSGSLVENAKSYPRFIGQERALKQLCVALCRSWRNSVLIVGKPGSGRTALVERLAFEIRQGFSFDCNIRYFGSPFVAKRRNRNRNSEIDRDLLFVREIHDLFYDPEQIDSQRLGMIREIEDGRRFIGTTTPAGLAEIESDVSLRSRFETIYIAPTDKDKTLDIVRARADSYEDLQISEEALEQAYELSNEFADQLYPGHVQPSLMLDVLEHAACWVQFGREGEKETIVLSADDVLDSVKNRCRER